MSVLSTVIDQGSDIFRANRQHYEALLATLRERMAIATGSGRPELIERHHRRGKILVRGRIDLLVDADTPFLELSPLAAWENTTTNCPPPASSPASG